MNNKNSGGFGCLGVVQIVLIILKLLGLVSFSWWWVLLPTWIVLGLIALTVFICVVIYVYAKI